MSTNYYLTRRLSDNDYSWAKQLHIANKTSLGITLQAIVGHDGTPTPERTRRKLAGTLVYSEGLIPSIQSWSQWKTVLMNPDLVILDEYQVPIDTDEFIQMVENQTDKSARHHEQMQWAQTTNAGRLMVNNPEDHWFLDDQDYAFAWSGFC